jgi:hypothetical protein
MQRKEHLFTKNASRSHIFMGREFSHDKKATEFFKSELRDKKKDLEKKHIDFRRHMDEKLKQEKEFQKYVKDLEGRSADKMRSVSEMR